MLIERKRSMRRTKMPSQTASPAYVTSPLGPAWPTKLPKKQKLSPKASEAVQTSGCFYPQSWNSRMRCERLSSFLWAWPSSSCSRLPVKCYLVSGEIFWNAELRHYRTYNIHLQEKCLVRQFSSRNNRVLFKSVPSWWYHSLYDWKTAL